MVEWWDDENIPLLDKLPRETLPSCRESFDWTSPQNSLIKILQLQLLMINWEHPTFNNSRENFLVFFPGIVDTWTVFGPRSQTIWGPGPQFDLGSAEGHIIYSPSPNFGRQIWMVVNFSRQTPFLGKVWGFSFCFLWNAILKLKLIPTKGKIKNSNVMPRQS